VCDTYAELPVDFDVGDLATAEGKMYYGATVGMTVEWLELVAIPNDYAIGNLIRTNVDAVQIKAGQAVTSISTGVELANPANTSTLAIGLALGNINIGDPGVIVTAGQFSLDNWTDVIGSINLTVGSTYFLSNVSGKLSTTPPSGLTNQIVGKAITTKILSLTLFDYLEVN
jgi:hypothetical protein